MGVVVRGRDTLRLLTEGSVQVKDGSTLKLVSGGPAGPKGDRGETGPQGDPALPPVHFVQDDPLSVWTINHNRNTVSVSVTLRDQDGVLMYAPFAVQSPNQIVVSYPSPQAGTADLVF